MWGILTGGIVDLDIFSKTDTNRFFAIEIPTSLNLSDTFI